MLRDPHTDVLFATLRPNERTVYSLTIVYRDLPKHPVTTQGHQVVIRNEYQIPPGLHHQHPWNSQHFSTQLFEILFYWNTIAAHPLAIE